MLLGRLVALKRLRSKSSRGLALTRPERIVQGLAITPVVTPRSVANAFPSRADEQGVPRRYTKVFEGGFDRDSTMLAVLLRG